MKSFSNFLGIDTSNYTTSAAIVGDGPLQNSRKLLPVGQGERGLRQSDAVFFHTKQISEVLGALDIKNIAGIGYSDKPRSEPGSYMPCFLVGQSTAQVLAKALDVPSFSFSHQQGHIAAGILSCGNLDLLSQPFYAFHISGGTMEMLSVNGLDEIKICSKTLDITAGQLIDRVGVLLGLAFPCGRALEQLAGTWESKQNVKVCMKGRDCCLSGFENKAKDLYTAGESPQKIAQYIFSVVASAICEMVDAVIHDLGARPCLFVGGVMSNLWLRDLLSFRYDAFFAEPDLSCDNAAGVAYLAGLKYHGKI